MNLHHQPPPAKAHERPWIGVHFTCARAYIRVYRSVDGAGYTVRCPKCARSAQFRVGPGGISARQFEVTCQPAA